MDENDQDQKQFLFLITPTKAEIITIPIVSFIFLLVDGGLAIFKTLDSQNFPLVTELAETYLRSLLRYIDLLLGNTILSFLFWMIIGFVVYILAWGAISAFNAYKDDLPITKGMLLPTSYSQSGAIHEAMVRIMMRAVCSALMLLWLWLFISSILPYASNLFTSGLLNVGIATILKSLFATLLLSASIFLTFILARCIMLRVRVFGR